MKREVFTRFTENEKKFRTVVAYEMLIGLLPYTGATNVELDYYETANGGRIKVTWKDGIDVNDVIPMLDMALGE